MSASDKTQKNGTKELKDLRQQVKRLQNSESILKDTEEQLTRVTNELRIILNTVPATIWYKDAKNNIVRVNQAAADAIGRPVEDIEGKSCAELFPEEADHYYEDDLEVIRSGEPKLGIVEQLQAVSGEKMWVRTDKIPYLDEDGSVAGVLVFAIDITEYKNADARLKEKSRVLEGINRVFREALICRTEKELAATCLSVVEEVSRSEFGYIGELNPAGLFDTLAISNPGMQACEIPEGEATLVVQDMPVRGVDRAVMRTGQSRIINGEEAIASHPDHVEVPVGHPPITAFMGVPLKHGGKTIGMIGLANKEGGYGPEDQEAVELLGVSIVEAMRGKRAELRIAQQSEEMLELSTPVIEVWKGIVVAPLIGTLDSQRTQRFMEVLLERVVETKSPVALVDITGVPAVDTQTAQHLIEAITAARLLGTRVMLTGVRPVIAQTLVHLGIDMSGFETYSSLAGGLRGALQALDLEIAKKSRQ